MFTQKFLISVLMLGCCAIPASATLVTYCANTGPGCGYSSSSTASSAFTAATTDDTFNNIAVTQGNLGTSYTDATGVEFSDPLGMTGTANPSGWPAGSTGTAITSKPGVTTMTITFPSSVDAIDLYVGMQDFSNFTISVTDSTGGTFSSGYFEQTNVMAPLFFGVTTSSTFTSFTITSQASADQITLDDISIGSAATPEAATLLLVGAGLFVMGYFRRRLPRRDVTQAARRGTVSTMSTGITPA